MNFQIGRRSVTGQQAVRGARGEGEGTGSVAADSKKRGAAADAWEVLSVCVTESPAATHNDRHGALTAFGFTRSFPCSSVSRPGYSFHLPSGAISLSDRLFFVDRIRDPRASPTFHEVAT